MRLEDRSVLGPKRAGSLDIYSEVYIFLFSRFVAVWFSHYFLSPLITNNVIAKVNWEAAKSTCNDSSFMCF